MKSLIGWNKKSGIWISSGLALIIAVVLISSCSESRQPQNSGDASSPSFSLSRNQETWQVVVKRLSIKQKNLADVVYESLVKVQGISADKARIIRDGDYLIVGYGQYPSFEDAAAQKDMRFIKSLGDAEGRFPFIDAHLELMPEPDPQIPADWLLTNTKGYWTLQIGQFHGAGRKQAAVEMVKELRNQNLPVYVYHGPVKSMVTIGEFPETAFSSGSKKRVMGQFKANDPELRKWIQKFPYMVVNTGYARFKTKQGKTQQLRLNSQTIRIPREGESIW